jgi:hypothetical protein
MFYFSTVMYGYTPVYSLLYEFTPVAEGVICVTSLPQKITGRRFQAISSIFNGSHFKRETPV